MTLNKRIEILEYIGHLFGKALNGDDCDFPGFDNIYYHNPWFTKANVEYSLNYWKIVLNRQELEKWLNPYNLSDKQSNSTLALVFAGNIPLVGMHDFICAIASGVCLKIKLSSKDKLLPVWLIESLQKEFPELVSRIESTEERLSDFDGIIATGSNNSSRYFEYYFGKYKHIIRKNRNSIAVLDGSENNETLQKLADDIFLYFGLGCRSVSKIFIPKDFDFNLLVDAFSKYDYIGNFNKYANNYDYWKAVYMMDRVVFKDSGFLLLSESKSMHSPPAVLHYEYYTDINKLNSWIELNQTSLQCVLSEGNVVEGIDFGKSQLPSINEYADNVDTINFIKSL